MAGQSIFSVGAKPVSSIVLRNLQTLQKPTECKKKLTKFSEGPKPDKYFRDLCPKVKEDIEKIESNWRSGNFKLERINCQSENSKGVYCLQYDDDKIVSGLRDNTIKLWDRKTLECRATLTGHTGSVLCLQVILTFLKLRNIFTQ